MRTTSRAITMSAALIYALSAQSARADLFALSTSGTIDTSTASEIPVGTPWSLYLVYETDAPDQDFTVNGGTADPTFGRFTNTGTPPAMVLFDYRAGSYEATIDDPADFGPLSKVQITFTSVHAIDIDILADDAFPSLAGGSVRFHADFNDFSSRPIFMSDGLPTNTALSPASFDQSTVSLLTHGGVRFVEVDGRALESFEIIPLPEPEALAQVGAGVAALAVLSRMRRRAGRPARA